ncbi:glycosyltransferase family 39 protein [Caldovatus aquaticus]|uniref:Glycosyltransferase family 39 protein n=1 Tax=Caldovatus aquaticus TaxID=2865671 RepID=A0ABS7F596_9PROT|nr:glycosyltransferase family 39 protein [Caldovatus aquaticus]MBW8270664.1 glycosyltransferase family 39 protein [Caldovatus aquaticus]
MSVWALLLLGATGLRLLLAALVPLAPDEAYYWVWSRHLQPGYLDHPPMVALWIAAGTALLGETPLGVRLLGPLSVALGSVLLARAAAALFPDRPGCGPWAAALLNATLALGVGAVVMTPDTPLLFFWTLALWALARLHRDGDARWWLLVGLAAGAALASKYTAALLGLGILLWLLLSPPARRWFRAWQLWAGGVLALAAFAPVLAWNAAHGWASFAKQGGRAGGGALALRHLGELVLGQIGLATPLVFLLCAAGAAAALRRAWPGARGGRDGGGASAALLLAALVLPGALLFVWQSLGSRVQGNWPAILYPAAGIAAACLLGPRWARLRVPAVVLGAALTALVYLQAAAAPLPLPRRSDPTLARLGGWAEFAAAVEAARAAAGAEFVAAEEYGLASELAFRLPPGVTVVALEARWRLFSLPPPPPGATGVLVRSERRGEGPPLWPGAAPLGITLVRARRGVEAERYRLWRVETGPALPPAARLPRPRAAAPGEGGRGEAPPGA